MLGHWPVLCLRCCVCVLQWDTGKLSDCDVRFMLHWATGHYTVSDVMSVCYIGTKASFLSLMLCIYVHRDTWRPSWTATGGQHSVRGRADGDERQAGLQRLQGRQLQEAVTFAFLEIIRVIKVIRAGFCRQHQCLQSRQL